MCILRPVHGQDDLEYVVIVTKFTQEEYDSFYKSGSVTLFMIDSIETLKLKIAKISKILSDSFTVNYFGADIFHYLLLLPCLVSKEAEDYEANIVNVTVMFLDSVLRIRVTHNDEEYQDITVHTRTKTLH